MSEHLTQQEIPQGLHDERSIQEMLLLAARLKESAGGELDDQAIQAVSEATGVSEEFVRIALLTTQTHRKRSVLTKIREALLSLHPSTRRHVTSGGLAMGTGMAAALSRATNDPSSIIGVIQICLVALACWNVATARNARVAAVSGALFGGLFFVAGSLFGYLFGTEPVGLPIVFVLLAALGAVTGLTLNALFSRSRKFFGLKDPAAERQELLRQLVNIQEKLKTGQQSVTFLNLDMVGSTRLKMGADPLDVEFTFTEYHRYVEAVISKHGGQIHSTAGDGIVCAFPTPVEAFSAAKHLQAGLIELNTHRNRLGTPIQLRSAIHSGIVNAPTSEIQSVNFSEVIDISAHLQKQCPPGGIAVSDAAAQYIHGGAQGIGAERISDQGISATIWLPRKVAVPTTGGPPAPPLPITAPRENPG